MACYKITFEHKHEAISHINQIHKRLKGKMYPYECTEFGKFHLSSRDDDPKRAKEVKKFYQRIE